MTPTPTTPAAAAREQADALFEIINDEVAALLPNWRDMPMDELAPVVNEVTIKHVAAALLSARQAAQADQLEDDCKAVCHWCKSAPDSKGAIIKAMIVDGKFTHNLDAPGYYDGETEECRAAPIRAQAAATKESERK